MRHVHADLMGAPRFQPAFDQHGGGRRAEPFQQTGAGDRMTALVGIDGLLLPVAWVAGQMRGDAQDQPVLEADARRAAQARVGRVDHPMRQRQIAAVGGMRLKLGGQPVMGAVGFRHDQQPRGVLVDAVHDAGALFPANARQRIAAMRQQRVDQRTRRAARSRMNDHARGLVDHDQVIILMRDDQGDGLGAGLDRFGGRQGDVVFLPLGHAGLAVAGGAVGAGHGAFGDQPRQAGPRQGRILWHRHRKRLIKSVGRIGRNGHGKDGHGAG